MDLLAEITGVGGDFNTAIGSAQSTRFVGGPQALSKGLAQSAAAAGAAVVTGARRSSGAGRPPCTRRERTYRGRQVIVTVPKSVTAAIRFDPALPAGLRPVPPAPAVGVGREDPGRLRDAVLAGRRD